MSSEQLASNEAMKAIPQHMLHGQEISVWVKFILLVRPCIAMCNEAIEYELMHILWLKCYNNTEA